LSNTRSSDRSTTCGHDAGESSPAICHYQGFLPRCYRRLAVRAGGGRRHASVDSRLVATSADQSPNSSPWSLYVVLFKCRVIGHQLAAPRHKPLTSPPLLCYHAAMHWPPPAFRTVCMAATRNDEHSRWISLSLRKRPRQRAASMTKHFIFVAK